MLTRVSPWQDLNERPLTALVVTSFTWGQPQVTHSTSRALGLTWVSTWNDVKSYLNAPGQTGDDPGKLNERTHCNIILPCMMKPVYFIRFCGENVQEDSSKEMEQRKKIIFDQNKWKKFFVVKVMTVEMIVKLGNNDEDE